MFSASQCLHLPRAPVSPPRARRSVIGPLRVGALDPASQEGGGEGGGRGGLRGPSPPPPPESLFPQLAASASRPRRGVRIHRGQAAGELPTGPKGFSERSDPFSPNLIRSCCLTPRIFNLFTLQSKAFLARKRTAKVSH